MIFSSRHWHLPPSLSASALEGGAHGEVIEAVAIEVGVN
jgi:hypothetical protein